MRKIGAHVSAQGGLEKAIERAREIGANCAQIFSGSPRVWKRRKLSEFNTKKMFSKIDKLDVNPIFTHSLYLVNLASRNPELLRKSFEVLQYDLQFDSMIQGSGIVVHLGSHTGRGWDAIKEQVAEQIVELLESTPANSTFLIENSAGQNGKLCSDLAEIRWLTTEVERLFKEKKLKLESRLGWCFDTCHGHAAGYSLGEDDGSLIHSNAIETISRFDLWDTLKCIHVNDSRDAFASGKDRHANLGEGNIPKDDLIYFLNYEKVIKIPLIIEVPGYEGKGPDARNIEYLKRLCK
jgi:deoxyribonuclease-4